MPLSIGLLLMHWVTHMNGQFAHKWWSTVSLLCVRLDFVPAPSCWLAGGGGGVLVCESVGKANLLSDQFDNKQSVSVS